jgi:hypothetical protein
MVSAGIAGGIAILKNVVVLCPLHDEDMCSEVWKSDPPATETQLLTSKLIS